ncbi:hypothetical protein CAOG_07973 [Capsaspora owczarzaki ATCC 30864]|uniref:Uncharacterized protein n=1 Tax=Capsaspora owczarzaki (strain ATCC 30864) TaxID=595528 RepID=A0A0D2X5J0_CAPO3|nr:hypothetical protein CAOG_07973 [Capsaspora owczarzaki ATCC 30864]KJE97894.1 hypothetical protein CAOG_007973 [Capsaspora owczarzaki ATCC 30864]|eukprot:XP_004343061.2 hypothetical protein CAOG_07973 [Capsaspora owczarzaki ATCC 30864]
MGIRSNEVESLSRCKPISTSIDTGCVDYCRGIAAENMLHLTNIIGTLRIARSGREDKARTQIETLKALWSELGVQPQQGFEQQAFQGPPALVLSEENLDKLDQLRLDLLEARTNNAQQIAGFVEKLRLLWTRMRISESEQHMFVLEHDNVKFSSVTAFENELSRMMELKTTNMHRFIEAVRCELVELWDKCFFGEEQRHQFTHAFTNLCSEDTLQAHEQELERMEQYYADNANIFQLVSSHKQLEANLLELQSRASDTSKYNNRGGRMLQEQNATKKIQKELPVVRKQLIAALEEWESRHGKYFLVNGGRYLTTLETSLSASVVIGTLSRRPVSAMLNTSLNTSFSGGQNSSMLNTSGLNTSGLNTSGIDLNTSGLSSGSSTAAKRAGGARVAVSSSRQGNATVSAATSNVRKPVAPRAATAPRGVAPTQPVPAAKGTRGTILPPKAAANVGAVEVGAISIVEHTAPVVDFSSPRALPASFALCTSAAGMVIHESPAPRVETLRTVSANTPVRAVAAKSPMPGANRPLLQLLLTPCKTLSLDQENGTPTSVHEFSFDHDVPELSRMSVVPQFNESTI